MPNKDHDQHIESGSATSTASQAIHAAAAPSQTLAGFWTLPTELQHRIFILACGPPALHRYTIVGRSDDCTTTMLSLLQTAKSLSPIIAPLLYRHVRLTRPSALRSFLRTVLSRPSLGELVQSHHLGADKEVSLDWCPARAYDSVDSDRNCLKLNLAAPGGSWRDCLTHILDVEDFDADTAKANALDEAFQVATQYVDVDLNGPRSEGSPPHMFQNEWYVRVFELQAIMELYYLEMLRCEERKDKSGSAKVKHTPPYPRLCIGSSGPLAPSAAADFNRPVFEITCSQALQRLLSPGSPVDSFVHPYLWASSESVWLEEGLDHTLHQSDNALPEGLEARPVSALAQPGTSPSPPTMDDLIAVGKRILGLTPNVRNLSLTGIFERVLSSTDERPSFFSNLISLTVGPGSGLARTRFRLVDWELGCLTRLRLCGLLVHTELDTVSGNNSVLPQLSEFQWSIVRKGEPSNLELQSQETQLTIPAPFVPVIPRYNSLREIVEGLMGRNNKPSAGPLAGQKTYGEEEAGHDTASHSGARRRPCQTEARLHPHVVDAILKTAPNEEVAEAWRQGKTVKGARNPLKLVRHARFRDHRFDAQQELFDDGREWWDEACGGEEG